MDDITKVIMNKVNYNEIYRYLGYGKTVPDDSIRNIIDDVLVQLSNNIRPKSIYKIYDCIISDDNVYLSGITFKSKNLADNLRRCKKAVILVATLGIETDKLIQKYEILNIAKAGIAQACAAACIETYCNILQEDILLKLTDAKNKLYLRPRFSAGYGDLDLQNQKVIFDELECTKRIGVTLMDSLLMFPSKSVTAIIGLTDNPQGCHINKCKKCDNIGCEFRNE